MENDTKFRFADNTKEELLAELIEFEREREQLKLILGRIGGTKFLKKDKLINILFLFAVLGFFLLELFTEIFPRLLSLEVGVLLVSMKIVFMMHSQQKINHFQFWILNSIEYRMNEMSKLVKKLYKNMNLQEQESGSNN